MGVIKDTKGSGSGTDSGSGNSGSTGDQMEAQIDQVQNLLFEDKEKLQEMSERQIDVKLQNILEGAANRPFSEEQQKRQPLEMGKETREQKLMDQIQAAKHVPAM